jgi:hypothetical protein
MPLALDRPFMCRQGAAASLKARHSGGSRNPAPLLFPRPGKRLELPSSGFCGRMPPKWGPLWRGERAEEKPEGARAGCARVRCAHMDVRSANPAARSRTRRAGCPESAPPGVCFFGYFLCTSKESNPLARRASGSIALQDARSTWIPACAGMTSKERSWIPAFAGMANNKKRKANTRRERPAGARHDL